MIRCWEKQKLKTSHTYNSSRQTGARRKERTQQGGFFFSGRCLLGGLFVFGNTSQKKNKTRAPSKTFQTAGGMKAHNRYNVPLKCCILSRSTTLLDAEIRWRCCIIRRKTFCICKVNWAAHTHRLYIMYVYIEHFSVPNIKDGEKCWNEVSFTFTNSRVLVQPYQSIFVYAKNSPSNRK